MQIWMAMDPETRRILVQNQDFSEGDFPPGPRGMHWPRRTNDVHQQIYEELMAANVTPAGQDSLHRYWWDEARGEGEPLWPELPLETRLLLARMAP